MNDLREAESQRLSQKREMQHKEEMERIKVKRLRYDLKLLRLENERLRLNRRVTSMSPRRRTTHGLNPSPAPHRRNAPSPASVRLVPHPPHASGSSFPQPDFTQLDSPAASGVPYFRREPDTGASEEVDPYDLEGLSAEDLQAMMMPLGWSSSGPPSHNGAKT
ncbi:hypothetical protein C8J57DRAFT_1351837 [Mycena rebaudengoi]|nr:hypothetical protein C8J57DRAFT_1351837 [Mycena rebaudengoi]